MSKIVIFYNNKGGVSKTTTLFNVAVYLAVRGQKKVLMVDCDPQCNLTELFFASSIDILLGKELPGTSIAQALKPRFNGESSRVNVADVELVASTAYKNLSLLRGDFEFGFAESHFGNAINQAITENMHEKNTYLVLRRMFKDLADKGDYDYVLVDVGPSSGAITRQVFLSSDFFVLPTTPDRFCNQAITVLASLIGSWVKRHAEIMRTFPAFGLEVFDGKPVFVGAVSQNYKAHGGKAKESYAKWENEIGRNIKKYFLDPKTRVLGAAPGLNTSSPYIARIKDVGPLAPTSQMYGRAIFDLTQEQTEYASATGGKYYGAVWKTWEDRMLSYETEIGHIADALEHG